MLIRLGGIFLIIGIALWLWALFDSITTPPDKVRNLPKIVWVIAILLFSDVAAILWLVAGRPRGGTTGTPKPRTGRAPVAPDDDPEFLRKLGDDMRRTHPKPDDKDGA